MFLQTSLPSKNDGKTFLDNKGPDLLQQNNSAFQSAKLNTAHTLVFLEVVSIIKSQLSSQLAQTTLDKLCENFKFLIFQYAERKRIGT